MKAKLKALQIALKSGTIAEAGTAYREVEELAATVVNPPCASKRILMQTVRKHLMKHFGGEIMRVSTNVTARDLAEYDVAEELDRAIDLVDSHG